MRIIRSLFFWYRCHHYYSDFIKDLCSMFNPLITDPCAWNYRPSFCENKPKPLVYNDWIRAFWACFHENAGLALLTQMSPLAGKPFQGIATMTYTRWHTRPSQKDLARVVYPLNNKSLAAGVKFALRFWKIISKCQDARIPEKNLVRHRHFYWLDNYINTIIIRK